MTDHGSSSRRLATVNYKFTNEYSDSKLDEIISFISGPRLWIPKTDYPDFDEWAEKSWRELKKDAKRAMVAFTLSNVVGVVIYQRHKKIKDALELKNLTVRPEVHGRYIASFLLRNSEIEGAIEFKSSYVICDAKKHNLPIRFFLERHHYKVVGSEDLYSLNSGSDLIYQKPLFGWGRN